MEQTGDNSSFSRDCCARRGHLDLVGESSTNPCAHYVLPHGLETPGFEPRASAWLAFIRNCAFHCLHVENCWCQNNLGWGLGPTVLLTSGTGRKGDGQSECTYSVSRCLCSWPFYISLQKGQWVYKKEREKWRSQHTVGQIIDIYSSRSNFATYLLISVSQKIKHSFKSYSIYANVKVTGRSLAFISPPHRNYNCHKTLLSQRVLPVSCYPVLSSATSDAQIALLGGLAEIRVCAGVRTQGAHCRAGVWSLITF